ATEVGCDDRIELGSVKMVVFIEYDVYFMFFFFSSRRRHTRSDRDWSSDVCSSDLVDDGRITAEEAAHHPQRSLLLRALNGTEMRSEERRVGKECRSRWWREH